MCSCGNGSVMWAPVHASYRPPVRPEAVPPNGPRAAAGTSPLHSRRLAGGRMERGETLEGEREERPSRGAMAMRVLPFATFAVALVVLLHLYVGSRLIGGAGLTGAPRAAAWTALWALFLSVPSGLVASRLLPRRLAIPLQWLSHFWFGIFGLLVTAVAATDVLRACAR